MAINPLDLPSAAGVSFGQGDVRHFSEDDSVSVPGLQGPTRQLAERDNLLASKLNETIAVVNNKEQFVPLPILRTLITPGVEEVVANFRIPVGFEARILNMAIASTPASSNLKLKISYSSGFGSTTGIELVSTSDEFSAGTSFYNNGEMIVSITNSGPSSLEASASVTLTVRPVSERSSLLVGSVIQGDKGNRGDKGDKGDKGDPGTGTGSVPFVWKGEFSNATTYVPGDVVSYTDTTLNPAANGSSYRNKVGSLGVLPTVALNWEIFAKGGVPLRPRGVWLGLTPYVVGDIVTYATSVTPTTSVTSTYLCYLDVTSATDPATDTTHWQVLASGITAGTAETPTYAHTQLPLVLGGTPVAPYAALDGTYVGGDTDRDYTGGGVAGTNVARIVQQYTVKNSAVTPHGLAFLHSADRLVFKGKITIFLPQVADGAAVAWSTSFVRCIATVDTQDAEGAPPVNLCRVAAASSTTFTLEVLTTNARKVTITLFGVQQIP